MKKLLPMILVLLLMLSACGDTSLDDESNPPSKEPIQQNTDVEDNRDNPDAIYTATKLFKLTKERFVEVLDSVLSENDLAESSSLYSSVKEMDDGKDC